MNALNIVIIATVLLILLGFMWARDIGPLRAILATLCRVGWCAPFFLCLFPESISQYVPQSIQTNPIYVLLDDSESMGVEQDRSSSLSRSWVMISELQKACMDLACDIKIDKLSKLSSQVAGGFTPLRESLDLWLQEVGARPWLLFSDGGDWQPQEDWQPSLQSKSEKNLAKVIDLYTEGSLNAWVDRVFVAPFSFVDKPVEISFNFGRASKNSLMDHLQVHVYSGANLLVAKDVNFNGKLENTASLSLPSLSKGSHSLRIKVMPVAGEQTIWDNEVYASVEVLPNTVGLLHLLGAPSWDGRFVRRYLKSEPKYDLISFFILRDPWDSQGVDERDLSLIPFPTNRLFQEELPNFRSLIVQNFTMYQFLQPKHQNNLVKFIQDGGGALFIGGARAFQQSDIRGSPLKDVLPFTLKGNLASAKTSNRPIRGFSRSGSHDTYDPNLKFKIRLAKPSQGQRLLANVYEDWKALESALEALPLMQGMHKTDEFIFKDEEYTPLLEAELESGKRIPLAVASYPNKGRAIWIFTDQLWRLALNGSKQIARQDYSQFMHAAMSWLLRDELRRPLILSKFALQRYSDGKLKWDLQIEGPAARYLDAGGKWVLNICDIIIDQKNILYERTSANSWRVQGDLMATFAPGKQCWAKLEAFHSSFGSIKAQRTAIIPYLLPDKDIEGSSLIMRKIAERVQADYIYAKDYDAQDLRVWLRQVSEQKVAHVESKLNTSEDYFWVFRVWWVYFLFILIPLEILIRRWDLIWGAPLNRRSA